MYHIYWFVYVEPSLHLRDKSHLVLVNDTFNVLLNSIYWYFIENFCISIHQGYWPVVFFSRSVPSSIFWKSLKKIGINSFKMFGNIQQWNHLVLDFCWHGIVFLKITDLLQFFYYRNFYYFIKFFFILLNFYYRF